MYHRGSLFPSRRTFILMERRDLADLAHSGTPLDAFRTDFEFVSGCASWKRYIHQFDGLFWRAVIGTNQNGFMNEQGRIFDVE